VYRVLRNEKEIIEKNKTKKLFLVGNTCDLFSEMTAKWQNDLFCLLPEEKDFRKFMKLAHS
jgi:hypothetical protein